MGTYSEPISLQIMPERGDIRTGTSAKQRKGEGNNIRLIIDLSDYGKAHTPVAAANLRDPAARFNAIPPKK